jgi:diguanylate cyclase (GGDEF)-like protein/PAS domain S-box-containing protein
LKKAITASVFSTIVFCFPSLAYGLEATAAAQLQMDRDLLLLSMAAAGILFLLSLALYRNNRKLRDAKRLIENAEDLRRTFINSQEELVYLKDASLNYVFVNKALEEFYGKPADEIIGHDDYSLGDRDFAETRRNTDKVVLSQMTRINTRVEWKDRIYHTIKFPVELPDGGYGVGAYVRDVTEEEENKIQLEKNLMRNQILVDVSNRHFESEEDQLDYATNEMIRLTESEFGYIYHYQEDTKQFRLNSWSLGVMEECAVVEKQTIYDLEKTGIWGDVVRARKPLIVNDFDAPNPGKKGYPEGHVPLRRFLSLPVVVDGQIVAVVGLANKKQPYDNNDLYQVGMLMRGIWNDRERREAKTQLAREKEKYLLTLMSIGDAVMVVDRDKKIEMFNRSAEILTGWTKEEVLGRDYKEIFQLSHKRQGCRIKDPVEEVFRSKVKKELESHAILTTKNGDRFDIDDSAAPLFDGGFSGVVVVFRDVTEKNLQTEKIEYLSFHDSLTGLYNRRFFEEEIKRLDTSRNLPLSVLMGDINGLKLTNDVFGHEHGDRLLQKTAEAIRRVCRADDIIARWGGDEFIILLPRTEEEEAMEIAARIREQVAREQVKAVRGSIAIGCQVKRDPDEQIFHILDEAESAMYKEKILTKREIFQSTIKSIMDQLHMENPKERVHSEQVGILCQTLGKNLRLEEGEIRRLREAGYYHDIGKAVLEPELLQKKEPLNETDWQVLKEHPVVGYRILNASEETLDVADIVLYHHEHWDGGGYPKGLQGEAIPRLSRMLSIAESYEDMVDGNVYKKPMTQENAIREILAKAGSQFDPVLAQTFASLIKGKPSEIEIE